MKYPPDEQNICLKCNKGYKSELRYKPDGYDYYITYCGCEKGFLGKNIGHRKTCKYFEEEQK